MYRIGGVDPDCREWRLMLRDIGGVRIVRHDGGTKEQNVTLAIAPERDWAITALTKFVPNYFR
jgi:hypothetical protein